MSEPKNEQAVCEAVARLIGKSRREDLTVIDRPDQREREREAVELVLESSSGRFVMEHTRIESFPQQIADGQKFIALLGAFEEIPAGVFAPGRYDLIINVGAAGLVNRSSASPVRIALLKWILKTAPTLDANTGKPSLRWSITERPDGVPFDVTLQRSVTQGDSKIHIMRFTPPGDLEVLRRQRIQVALTKKLPKLATAKREHKAIESILILESDDIALANRSVIGEAVRDELGAHKEVPDSIYLAETDSGLGCMIWVLKRGNRVFPDVPEGDCGPFVDGVDC